MKASSFVLLCIVVSLCSGMVVNNHQVYDAQKYKTLECGLMCQTLNKTTGVCRSNDESDATPCVCYCLHQDRLTPLQETDVDYAKLIRFFSGCDCIYTGQCYTDGAVFDGMVCYRGKWVSCKQAPDWC